MGKWTSTRSFCINAVCIKKSAEVNSTDFYVKAHTRINTLSNVLSPSVAFTKRRSHRHLSQLIVIDWHHSTVDALLY
ncbi:MAG: hypothetical protein ACI8SJ_001220 [Shewanella sp.]|jgi:hypothetical protein